MEAYRIVEVSLLLQITKTAINNRCHGSAGFSAGRHQAAIARVGDSKGA
jgi:hypothetical protein